MSKRKNLYTSTPCDPKLRLAVIPALKPMLIEHHSSPIPGESFLVKCNGQILGDYATLDEAKLWKKKWWEERISRNVARSNANRKSQKGKDYHKRCQHNTRLTDCKTCRGSSICKHLQRKTECKACRGSAICKHLNICYPSKRYWQCKKPGMLKNVSTLPITEKGLEMLTNAMSK
jgi:hypothetical protein